MLRKKAQKLLPIKIMNVFDFDDTIYDGESVLDFFFWYIKKYPRLLKLMPRVLFAFAKYKAGRVTIAQALTDYAPEVEEFYRSIPDFAADCRDFWDCHMHKIRPFYKEIQQEDDLVISASPEGSIGEICSRLGIKNYIASVIDENGKITDLCMRSHKTEMFFERYPNGHPENFYTDSEKNDAPLIQISEHAFIVKGNKIRQIK